MTLTAKDVAEIIRLLEESSFDSLSLEMNGVKLNLRRGSPAEVSRAPDAAPPVSVPSETQTAKRSVRPATEPGLSEVSSPFLGVFYRAPRPTEPPFVEVGSKIGEETVIGIIEVMKMMNPVRAGVKGEVAEILAENGALVEYGEILIRVRPEARS